MVILASGYNALTACAIRCAVEWSSVSCPSGVSPVNNSKEQSRSIDTFKSVNSPSIFTTTTARAKPGPISFAMSCGVLPAGTIFTELSGNVIFISGIKCGR